MLNKEAALRQVDKMDSVCSEAKEEIKSVISALLGEEVGEGITVGSFVRYVGKKATSTSAVMGMVGKVVRIESPSNYWVEFPEYFNGKSNGEGYGADYHMIGCLPGNIELLKVVKK